jgi:hypothetical protein
VNRQGSAEIHHKANKASLTLDCLTNITSIFFTPSPEFVCRHLGIKHEQCRVLIVYCTEHHGRLSDSAQITRQNSIFHRPLLDSMLWYSNRMLYPDIFFLAFL